MTAWGFEWVGAQFILANFLQVLQAWFWNLSNAKLGHKYTDTLLASFFCIYPHFIHLSNKNLLATDILMKQKHPLIFFRGCHPRMVLTWKTWLYVARRWCGCRGTCRKIFGSCGSWVFPSNAAIFFWGWAQRWERISNGMGPCSRPKTTSKWAKKGGGRLSNYQIFVSFPNMSDTSTVLGFSWRVWEKW